MSLVEGDSDSPDCIVWCATNNVKGRAQHIFSSTPLLLGVTAVCKPPCMGRWIREPSVTTSFFRFFLGTIPLSFGCFASWCPVAEYREANNEDLRVQSSVAKTLTLLVTEAVCKL